jgi:ATP-dependent DNA ligase
MKIIKPMLLSYQEEVRSDDGWLYEPKYNGIRLLVGNDYSYTRHGTITTSIFPELLFNIPNTLLDGELIAFGRDTPDDFELAMSRFKGNKEQPISLMVFDILTLNQKSVVHYPLEERKSILEESLLKIDSSYFNFVPYVLTDGKQLFNVIKENNMEGIVAKRLRTSYKFDTRSDDWRKIINWRYHDVIVSKVTFNPLTVHLQSQDGNHLGSVIIGFTKEIRAILYSKTPPFAAKVKARGCTSNGKLRLPQIIEI